MFNYIIYDEAKEILDKTGLIERIEKINYSDFPSVSPLFDNNSLRLCLNDDFEKHKDKFPGGTEEWKKYATHINKFIRREGAPTWRINGEEYVNKKLSDLNLESIYRDILVSSGYYASKILYPDEIWDFEEFGFNSISEFAGVVGAAILNVHDKNYNNYGKYPLFSSVHYGNKNILKLVTACNHGDLEVHSHDITEYEVIDPHGNNVRYRPRRTFDTSYLMALQGSEPDFLNILLHYSKYCDLKLNIDEIIDKHIEEIGPYFDKSSDYRLRYYNYSDLDFNFDGFDSLDKTRLGLIGKFSDNSPSIKAFVDNANELIFKISDNVTVLRFQDKDIENAIEGVLCQSIHGNCSRTNPYLLINILKKYQKYNS